MTYENLKAMWAFCCFSPLLYTLLSLLLQRLLNWTPGNGLNPLSPITFDNALRYGAGYALAVQASFLFIWWRSWSMTKDEALSAEAGHNLLIRRCLSQLFLSETVVLIGFVFTLLQGDLKPVMMFGLAAMFLYAQSYPLRFETRE